MLSVWLAETRSSLPSALKSAAATARLPVPASTSTPGRNSPGFVRSPIRTVTVLELAERCGQATGPDRELDAKIARALGKIPLKAAYEGTAKIGDLAWHNGCGFAVPAPFEPRARRLAVVEWQRPLVFAACSNRSAFRRI